MNSPPDSVSSAAVHYLIDASSAPDDAWRVVASHHLLTSRHLPLATLSIVGVDDSTAKQLRTFAIELGLSGLRIPDPAPPSESLAIVLPTPTPPPSVICELVALSIAAHKPTQ